MDISTPQNKQAGCDEFRVWRDEIHNTRTTNRNKTETENWDLTGFASSVSDSDGLEKTAAILIAPAKQVLGASCGPSEPKGSKYHI